MLAVERNSKTWVGLFNPGAVNCGDVTSCTGQLYWADGEVLVGKRVDELNDIDLENVFSTIYRRSNNDIVDQDGNIDDNYAYLCEINCAMDVYIDVDGQM